MPCGKSFFVWPLCSFFGEKFIPFKIGVLRFFLLYFYLKKNQGLKTSVILIEKQKSTSKFALYSFDVILCLSQY